MAPVEPSLSNADPRTWRPQPFGRRPARQLRDPLIEPLWSGVRVLVHVSPGGVAILDVAGAEQRDDRISAALAEALAADEAVLDGYLTHDAIRSGEGIVAASGIEAPTAAQMARQMIVGGGSGDARQARDAAIVEAAARRRTAAGDGVATEAGSNVAEVAFVAVDLLALDGESLLDVPLLERKRLLDAVVVESDLVRRGIHVREPIDTWVRTWRALGFRELAFKDPNGRYTPGEPNDTWATAPIPTR